VNAWQIIQRQNKSALAVGSVTAGIPVYVAPTLKAFRIYGVYGDEPTAIDGAETILVGGAVQFYFEFYNPDGLEITDIQIDTDESWVRSGLIWESGDVWWNTVQVLGNGYLWQLCAGASAFEASPVTPRFRFTYSDPDGGSHTTDYVDCSNGPLTVSDFGIEVSPTGWLWVGDTVSVSATPEALTDSVDVTAWGDEA
jgi:hypothetical protein